MENNSFKYLVKLKPINNFFFGSDVIFGNFKNEETSNYLVKSRFFPQQTAILGLIRRQILVQKGLITKKVKGEWVTAQKKDDSILNSDNSKNYEYQKNILLKEEAKKLVGIGKFDINNDNLDLGIINKISPVFITKEGIYLFQINKFGEFKKEESCKSFINGVEKNFIPLLENFKYKDGILKNLVSLSKTEPIPFSKVFKEIDQIGNNKKEQENALFKKTYYRFLDDYEFSFILELKEEFILEESIISLGGDNSNFKMSSFKIDQNFNDLIKDINIPNNSITLFSDSYIKEDISNECDFSVNNMISFQNLNSSFIKDKKREIKPEIKFSDKKYFYEKGSVFFNTTEKFDNLINKSNLQQIGYNIFKKGQNNV